MVWNGSTENSVNQDHLASDDSALFSLHTTLNRLKMQYCKLNEFAMSISNISGRTTFATSYKIQNSKIKIKKWRGTQTESSKI